jgi:hypothetical protein
LKALTHNLFSLGVGIYLVYRIAQPPGALYLVLVVWSVFATNAVIDTLGHVNKEGRSVRAFWTHSIFVAPLWGIAVTVGSLYVLDAITGLEMTAVQAVFVAGLGAVLAYSHLLLDALTEGGVFFTRRRIALAHLRNNNLILNSAFAGLGVVLLLAAFV